MKAGQTQRRPGIHAREMGAGELLWLTDSTPHESLPAKKDGIRQFFRLVSHHVGIWFEQNSDKNPLGVEPPSHVQVVKECKFSDGQGG